jgi:phage major head subunit gpT-like protein
MIDRFYKVLPSDSAFEEFYDIGDVPDIPAFNGKLEYLNIAPGFYSKVEPKEFAGGLQFERKLLDDKKYAVLDDGAKKLARSAGRVKEKYGVRLFAYAFSTAFDFMTTEEGVSLCGAHLTKSGVSTANGFSNTGTSAISKTSIAATRLLMRKFRSDIGERIVVEPDTLIVPDNLYDAACEATGYMPETGAESQKDPDSANFKINSQFKRMKVIPYLRMDDYSTKNWFMADERMMKDHQVWIDRVGFEPHNTVDFETFVIKHSCYFRIGCGWLGWRHIYGQNVS